MRRDSIILICAAPLVVVTVILALTYPLAAVVLVVVAVLVAFLAIMPEAVAPILLVAAALFSRPNLLGTNFAVVGLALAALAAVLSILQDTRINRRLPNGWSTAGWLLVAFFAMFLALQARGELGDVGELLRPLALTMGTAVSAVIVLSSPQRRRVVGKLFVTLILVIAGSYAITLAGWLPNGPNAFLVTQFDSGIAGVAYRVYVPFTVTLAEFTLPTGLSLPRLTGLGREPGWMAMYAAFAFFLAPKLGWRRLWIRALLLLAMLGTFSTAGFAVFVIVLAYEAFLRRHDRLGATATFVLRTIGLAAVAAAAWVALFAPVIGVDAKSVSDRYSFGQRSDATVAGVQALLNSPFLGGGAASVVGGVNLIAAIAMYGVLFSAATVLAIWWPMIHHTKPAAATAPVLVVFLTLLTSQPPADSTWAYVSVLIAYASTQVTPLAGGNTDAVTGEGLAANARRT